MSRPQHESCHISLTTPCSSTSQAALDEDQNTVVWNSAERHIHDTESDILVIFDCCDAGALQDNHRGLHSFEFLGACEKGQITPKPGKTSFTSAMIWALRALAEEKPGFDSGELKSKIKQHNDFPNHLRPVLAPRLQPSGSHVWIEPANGAASSSPDRPRAQHYREETAEAAAEWLDLRLYFNRSQADNDIGQLAKGFIMHAQPLGLRRVAVKERFQINKAAQRWRDWTRKRRSSSLLSPMHRRRPNAADACPSPAQQVPLLASPMEIQAQADVALQIDLATQDERKEDHIVDASVEDAVPRLHLSITTGQRNEQGRGNQTSSRRSSMSPVSPYKRRRT